METEMYIKDELEEKHFNLDRNGKQQLLTTTMKYASTNSIPSTMDEENEHSFERITAERFTGGGKSAAILRDSTTASSASAAKGRRYSVLEDLKARRDSLWQRARRASTFDEKENAKQLKIVYGKDKRRSSDGGANRRGSVFYVTDDLLEEKRDVLENEEEERAARIEAKKGRRKSWHPLANKPSKSERKRKKAVVGAAPLEQVASAEALYTQTRQKRPSWWNIFVPDSVSRSKSRSVDHGFTAPFDLDSLRNKVEGRFESVDKLSKDSDNESKDGSTTQEKKHGRISQPINTIAYTVGDRDTLTSVAARFDTTPSELSKLNRLGSTFIYPGQQLWVPNKKEGRPEGGTTTDAPSPDPSQDHDSQDDLPPEEKELLDNLRPVSPKPGHIERVKTPLGSGNAVMEDDEQPFKERFLKINVRHITDGQGVVGGVLLVTPNAVMFDPNVSDPLVIEHGAESYGVIAPMEFVVNAAIYYDIAHMRVGHAKSGTLEKKPDIYYMKKPSQGDSQKSQSPGKDETFPELAADDNESVCSCAEREGDAFPKAFDRELVTPTNLQNDDNLAPTKEKEEKEEKESIVKEPCIGGQGSRTLEERRRSMLDHHWAVPSKDRSTFSVDDEQQDSLNSDKTESAKSNAIPENEEGSLVKMSCHDSGIDIRDPNPPLPIVQPMPAKKVYSDADIVLSSDWVPPITIAPTNITTSSLDSGPTINGRKKASSVSFSLDSNNEEPEKDEEHKDDDKQESRKNKMLKRLSYPLSWVGMEGLTGDREDESKSVSDRVSSLPNSADSHHSSVFSKVFSSSPINLVSDFSSGLFAKTPSEESGGGGRAGGTPPLIASYLSQDSGNAQFSPGPGGLIGVPQMVPAFRRSSVGTFIRQQPLTSSGSSSVDSSRGSKTSTTQAPRLDYRSMVSVEDMPGLFVSFDIQAPNFPELEGLELIPRPARSCEDPPLYLRLRTGRPKDKKIPRSTPIMSYGKKKLRPEYWFSVPRNRVDDLYRFIHAWVPNLYGELDENYWRERGYILSDTDTDLSPELTTQESGESGESTEEGKARNQDGDDISELTRESWELIKAPYVKLYAILKTSSTSADSEQTQDPEVLSMSEELRRALYANSAVSLDNDIIIPDLVGTTEILSDEHREHLCRHLPARAEGYLWTLVFSTSQNGFSLNSMYRKMGKIESPILLVIEDTEGNVFGALTSCALHVSDHFYGTGESLLFRFTPRFQAFNWTGDNLYFIKGNNESLAIGAGDGKFGLWLDGDLYQGRTQSCSTYGNEPLAPHEDFVVKTLECWAFI
ncbi:PREDICTED: nuclear receptor coactivator 7 isoform X5 [Polistes canadensis]|uniref:nuclear receptor coactivator 7 isoform X5 n=1 Tax=Polistes canadensis TaxID=91411 RepID=UPI000718FDE4|nr:PREDICTED: nuclear receptor coactivator 7 isoform X5 [Polistes canadensis]